MNDAHSKAMKVLRALEFGFRNRCPICVGFDVGPNGETDRAHRKDCPVPEAIAAQPTTNKE